MPGEAVSTTAYSSTTYCDRAKKCKCYQPKCTNKACTVKYKGQCFMKGMTIPEGSVAIRNSKGKPVMCSKKIKCACYRVPLA